MAKQTPLSRFVRLLSWLFTLGAIGVVLGGIAVVAGVTYFGQDLPDHNQLADYNPPTVTRLYAADGQMLAEYASEKRLYVPGKAIPERVKQAFIAAEDKNFYHHPGVDIISIARAAVQNLRNLVSGSGSLVGGSTITQQVVKNFLLTNERSLERKIKEAILAFRITQAFSKERIMELYLNEIYLGNRSYGVAAAALNYFNKSVDELTIEEAALLAAMPKAPSDLDPVRHPERALERRNWVIGRMQIEGFISQKNAEQAKQVPIVLAERDKIELVNAGFFADAVRSELIEKYGEKGVYESGYAIRTTLEPKMQHIAEKALHDGLVAYDRRHGWRGALDHISLESGWQEKFAEYTPPAGVINWDVAVVLDAKPDGALISLQDGSVGRIPLSQMKWARAFVNRNTIGAEVKTAESVVKKGDIIAVQSEGKERGEDIYSLQQIPEVNGALVAMNPYTGQVLAMVGGYYYGGSQFNRAVQAKRQPGSAFKPFVYLSALENGFTPSSIIVDEEIQLDMGEDMPDWRPQNHSGKYYGPSTLRLGMEKSRNAMTVRLAQLLGIKHVVEIAKRFKIHDKPPYNFSLPLGAAETTLLDITTAYGMLVNGGKRIEPFMLERIQKSDGETEFRRDNENCKACDATYRMDDGAEIIYTQFDYTHDENTAPSMDSIIVPELTDTREQVTDPIHAYQSVSMLEGVVIRGTGRAAAKLGYTLAGKTGTTNESFDTWFLGFSPNLVVGVYAGFDNPQSMGRHEYGSSVALPIWQAFMKGALEGTPDVPFRRPDGVKLVKIDRKTGLLPSPDTPAENIIYEAFMPGTEPTSTTTTSMQPEAEDGQDEGFSPLTIY